LVIRMVGGNLVGPLIGHSAVWSAEGVVGGMGLVGCWVGRLVGWLVNGSIGLVTWWNAGSFCWNNGRLVGR
jgi:hypothetical protein